MASGDFLGMHLHPVDDPDDSLELSNRRRDDGPVMQVTVAPMEQDSVEIQEMSDGRQRAIWEGSSLEDGPSEVVAFRVDVVGATRDVLTHLRRFRGRTLCARHYSGDSVYYGGVFTRMPQPKPGIDWIDFGFVFTCYDHDPAV